jgi:hypothetical protein
MFYIRLFSLITCDSDEAENVVFAARQEEVREETLSPTAGSPADA